MNAPLARFLAVSGRDYRFTQGSGCKLVTDTGDTFSDFIAGFGALSFGHNPEFVHEAIAAALSSAAPNLYVEALNPFAGELAARLVRAAGPRFESCFFANGGAEAIEAALKTALLSSGRRKIVYAAGGYHGT